MDLERNTRDYGEKVKDTINEAEGLTALAPEEI